MAEQKQPTLEDGFRAALEDVVKVLEGFAPHCGTFEELVGICRLALKNDGQLKLMMDHLTKER